MSETLIVRGAPQEYICKIGAWNYLADFLSKKKIKNILVLHGDASWEVAEKFFPLLNEVTIYLEHYKQECSYENAAVFEKLVKEKGITGIVAVGGGKVLDLGKLVASNCLIDVVCLPTLASTCAAYTPLSIVYNEAGEMVDMKFLSQSVSATLVDPEVILNSPVEFLVAGIGDTLAKWYESDPVISAIDQASVEIQVAQFAAKSCKDNLLAYGKEAITDLQNQTLSESFVKVIETNILLAGMVGGFGDKYGRSSGAHAIHDALTYIEATHHHLHGNKVAYGILVQLAVEKKMEEIEQLISFYQELELPYQLEHLDVTLADIQTITSIAAKDELFHQLPQEITEETIKEAILSLE